MFSRRFLTALALSAVAFTAASAAEPTAVRRMAEGSGSFVDCGAGSGSGSSAGSGYDTLSCTDNGVFSTTAGYIEWTNPTGCPFCDEWVIGKPGEEITISFPVYDLEDGNPHDLLTICDDEGCVDQDNQPEHFPVSGEASMQPLIMTAPVFVRLNAIDHIGDNELKLVWEPTQKPFNVSVLFDDKYIDTRVEGPNMLFSAVSNSSIFASTYETLSAWVGSLSHHDTAMVPELDGLSGNRLSEEHASVILDFVKSGGTLVTASDDQGDNHDFLNQVFGWSTRQRYWTGDDQPRQAGAQGTCFDAEMGAPATVPDETYVTYTDARRLPDEATVLYSDGGAYRQVAVWSAEVGSGRVYMLAYDWHKGPSVEWDWVLRTALTCHAMQDIMTTSPPPSNATAEELPPEVAA